MVVWQLAREQGERPLSVYVSDGMFEFSLNTRLPAIVQHMQSVLFPNSLVTDESEASGLILVKHIFMDEEFRRLSRSYCEPCGHPWAAVVLFDSLLVCRLNILIESTAFTGYVFHCGFLYFLFFSSCCTGLLGGVLA